jgi:hypothetical protein
MTPQDAPDSANTLIYLLEHSSREAARSRGPTSGRSGMDQVSADSQVGGRIVTKVVSVFGDPTDYSPMK